MRVLMRRSFVALVSIVLILFIASPALAENASFAVESCVAQPDSIAIPQEAVITVTIGGDHTVERVLCTITCRNVVELASSLMSFSTGDGTWTATLSLPEYLSEGYYNISVTAYDIDGNFITQDYEDILYVSNDHADTVLPDFISGTLETAQTKVPADVFVSAQAQDENGVVYFHSDAYIIPGKEYGSVELEYNAGTQKWEGYLSLPAEMPTGSYTVVFFIYDGACNFHEGEFSQKLYITGVDETKP